MDWYKIINIDEIINFIIFMGIGYAGLRAILFIQKARMNRKRKEWKRKNKKL